MKETAEADSPLMDVLEVSKFTKLAKATVRDMVFKRRIPHVKLLGRVFFRRSDIENWINASEVPAHSVRKPRKRNSKAKAEAR